LSLFLKTDKLGFLLKVCPHFGSLPTTNAEILS
jgi:hypothetical protein